MAMRFQVVHHATRERDIGLHSEFEADTLEEAVAHVRAIEGINLQAVTLWALPLRYTVPLDNPDALSGVKSWIRLGART